MTDDEMQKMFQVTFVLSCVCLMFSFLVGVIAGRFEESENFKKRLVSEGYLKYVSNGRDVENVLVYSDGTGEY